MGSRLHPDGSELAGAGARPDAAGEPDAADAVFLLELSETLESAEDLKTAALRTIHHLWPLVGADLLAVLARSPEGVEVLAYEGEVPSRLSEYVQHPLERDEARATRWSNRSPPRFVDDYRAFPQAIPALVEAGLTGSADVPFLGDGDVVCTLSAYRIGAPAPWTARQRALLVASARILGAVAKRVRRVRQLLEAAAYSEALAVALHVGFYAEDASSAAADVARTLASVADVDLGILTHAEGDAMQVDVVFRGERVDEKTAAALCRPVPREESLAASRAFTSEPLFVDDYLASQVFHAPFVALGVRSVALLPLSNPGDSLQSAFIGVRLGRARAWTIRDRELFEAGASAVRAAGERAARMRELAEVARTDALTGLPNRRAYLDDVDAACALATRHGHPLTLVAIDLDGMKAVNDRDGHARGDELLRVFAREVPLQFRGGDRAYRTGGDEFVLVLPHTPLDPEFARVLDERFAALDAALHAAGFTCAGASFGAAAFPADGASAAEVLAAADRRLYARKAARRQRPAPLVDGIRE